MKKEVKPVRVVKSTYYSNWGDRFGYPAARFVLPLAGKIGFLTPNMVTLTAFFSYAIGCVLLILNFPYHQFIAGVLILAGYIGDDLDGQLARYKKLSSTIGDYMDKVLDIVKMFLITFFPGLAMFLQTDNVLYLILGFIAGFFFMLRYYIKLESMFSSVDRNPKYLEQSSEKRHELEAKMDELYAKKAKNLSEAFTLFITKNRTILWVDEAEFAIFVAIGAFVGRLDIVLWILAISQVTIGLWRLFERGRQLQTNSPRLLWPMRK